MGRGTEPHTTNKGIDPQRPKSITAHFESDGQAQEFGTHSKSNAMSFGNLLAICTVGTRCSTPRVRRLHINALAVPVQEKQTNAAMRHKRAGSPPLRYNHVHVAVALWILSNILRPNG